MSFSLAALLLVASLQAPGEIYRCPSSDGSIHFQDEPCSGGQQFKGGSGDEQALREWLQGMAAPARAAPPAGQRAPAPALSASERLIAVCSERFLACASDQAAAMDRCVAALPRCSAQRQSGCCPAGCISAYQSRRSQGSALAAAVRGALLDPSSGPSCAAASP